MTPEIAVAVALSPAVNRFWAIRQVFVSEGMTVPEYVEDGWDQLLRIRDWAEYELRVLWS